MRRKGKSQFNFATVILTRDSPQKLERLLDSIQHNSSVSQTPLLIIDDSYDQSNRKKNRLVASKYTYYYIDSLIWNTLRKNLLKQLYLKTVKSLRLLQSFTLGEKEWNGYNGRNISMIIIKVFFKSITHTFHLDDDMIISQRFTLPQSPPESLSIVRIEGSPDAARREWIGLYLLYLCKKYNVKPIIYRKYYFYYPLELIDHFSISDIEGMISRYTDLAFVLSYPKKDGKVISPPRDFIAGAYITSTYNYKFGLFPNCYDEDWSWYNKVRQHNRDQKLIEGGISHEASRKQILIDKFLRFEEDGSIISYAIRNRKAIKNVNYETLSKYVYLSTHSLENNIRLAQLLLPKVNSIERDELKRIIKSLIRLTKYMKQRDLKFYTTFIEKMIKNDQIWKKMLKASNTASLHDLSQCPDFVSSQSFFA